MVGAAVTHIASKSRDRGQVASDSVTVTQVLTAQYERSSFQGREKGPQPLRVRMSRSHYKKSFFCGGGGGCWCNTFGKHNLPHGLASYLS